MKTISIIGAGRLGKTLGRLFHDNKVFRINSVISRSIKNAEEAAIFIGAGTPADNIEDVIKSDIYLISTPDGIIKETFKKMKPVPYESIVFHCSGSLPSSVIDHKNSASIHPVHSFAAPKVSIMSFSGTMCGCEGDKDTLSILKEIFKKIGGVPFDIDGEKKSLYHAAAVMACNYFTAIQETAIKMYEESGVSREEAYKILEPIVKGTANNIFQNGTANSLTGPIARGDSETITSHLEAIKDEDILNIYKVLGKIAVELSEKQGIADKEALAEISKLFNK